MKAKRRKRNRQPETNRHHLLFQRKHWDRNGIALAIRNHFIYEMNTDHHNHIHANLHDIPLPPAEDLERIWQAIATNQDAIRTMTPRQACRWLAYQSEFEPFRATMLYQAELIGGR